jgi:hypothetical protein
MDEETLKKVEETELLIGLRKYFNKYGFVDFWRLFNEIVYEENRVYWKNKVVTYELMCPAVMELASKEELNHKERIALMLCYLRLGNKGEERLWEILKKQKNFNEAVCRTNIESYKKKGKLLGISCEKLVEWGICHIGFEDCHKYKLVREKKND